MNQEKIGKFIAKLRKQKKLTQEQLAEKLGITKNAVSKWERGLGLMDLSLLKPLSYILEVSVTEILNGEKIDEEIDLSDYSLKIYFRSVITIPLEGKLEAKNTYVIVQESEFLSDELRNRSDFIVNQLIFSGRNLTRS